MGAQISFRRSLKHDLVDAICGSAAFWLNIFPITLGGGNDCLPMARFRAAFKVTESTVTSKRVIIVNYERAGAVDRSL